MVRLLNWLAEVLMRASKKPWARFIVSGITDDGQVRFDMAYNKAFIKNLSLQGLAGASDEETVQNFLFGSIMAPKGFFDDIEQEITSDAHPFLTSETNKLKR